MMTLNIVTRTSAVDGMTNKNDDKYISGREQKQYRAKNKNKMPTWL